MNRPLRARRGRAWGADAIAVAAGAASVLAFAPFKAWPLAMVCPALLFALWSGGSARQAAWRGFLYGAAEFLAGIYWIYISVSGLGPAPWWLGVLLYIVLSFLCAAFPAIIGYFTRRLAPTPGAGWLLLIPALWTLFEWIRSFALTGFPWFALGFSQATHWLGGYAPVFGLYGVSFACVAVAVLAVLALRTPLQIVPRAISVTVLGAIFLVGAVLGHVAWTRPHGPIISVALMQGDIPQQEKWTAPAVKLSLDRYMSMTRRHLDADLVVWPEAAIPAWYIEVAPALEKFSKEAGAHGVSVVYGVLAYDWRDDKGYNAVAAMGAGVHRDHSVYYKRHLVPFGEYFPVPKWIKGWLSAHSLPHSSFTAGPLDQPPLAVKRWRIAVANCYEIAFGRLLRRQLPLADFIVNVTDDGWFGHSIASAQQFQMTQTAARETGRYVLAGTNGGITGIVDPRGRVERRLPTFEKAVLTGHIRAYVGATPYVKVGNWLIVCLCLGLLIAGLARRLFRGRASRLFRERSGAG